MAENHRTELSISAIYKEFSSVLQPLWMTETMPRLIISDRSNNEIFVKGPAGQGLSTNDLTNILSSCCIHLLNYSFMKRNRYEAPSPTSDKLPSFSSLLR